MKQDKITSLQYATLTFFLLNSFFMNVGYYTITRISNNDSIFDILIGGIGIIILFCIVSYIRKQNKINIIEYIKEYLPKPISLIIYLIFFIIIGITAIYSLTILISFIHYYILKEVSMFIITITITTTIIYIVKKGLRTISKISEIFFYIYIFIIIVSIIGLIKYINPTNLKPLLTNNLTHHITSSMTYFLSSPIPLFLLLIIPSTKTKSNLHHKKIPFIFTIITIILCFLQLIIIISVLGIELTNIYQNPDMIIYKKISFLNVLERVETLLSFNNILNSLFIIIMSIYFLKEIINNFIDKKKEPISLALIGIIIIISSSIINIININVTMYLILNLITLFLILIIFFSYFPNKHNL